MDKFSHFPDIPSHQADQAADAGYRPIVSTGGPILEVPGLKKVVRVRIGGTEVPIKGKISMLDGLDESKPQKEYEVEYVKLDKVAGVPVLRRSTLSNDGVWQAGTVYVAGDWEPEKPAEATGDKGTEGGAGTGAAS